MKLTLRSRSAVSALLIVAGMVMPSLAYAEGAVMLTLEPHCAEADRIDCPLFTVADAESITTSRLNAGDIVDIDVVLTGGANKNIKTIRSWLLYDTKVLEARSVELTPLMEQPIPGEQNIDSALGLVKIGANTGGIESDRTAIARVTFRVASATTDTVIRFQNFTADGFGQTAVNTSKSSTDGDAGLPAAPCFDKLLGCGDITVALLMAEPAKLNVDLADVAAPDTTAVAAGVASLSSSSSLQTTSIPAVTTNAGNSNFGLLQVQNVQATTRDGQIYVGWQQLNSSELAGYNVYYGTVSGRYIQRRSVASTSTSLVLRDLPNDSVYFLAIRAFNTANEESAFSQEVTVTVGKPETSSSPLPGGTDDSVPDTNLTATHGGRVVTGETGTADTILWLILGSAAVGTMFAFSRQLALSRHTHAA